MKNAFGNRINQQLVSYESLFKLLDDIQLHEDIQVISSLVAKQWKYFANVTSWRLVIADGDQYMIIDGYRGEASISVVKELSHWDYYHIKDLLPRRYKRGEVEQSLPPPDNFSDKAIAEMYVLPFVRTQSCIGILSASIRHESFSDLDIKFIRIFGNHLADKIHTILLRKRSIESLNMKATRDALTGLLNRGAIMDKLRMYFATAKRSSDSLCCVLVDIDFFKRINDTYGHLVGDRVLCEVSQRLSEEKRESDYLGRYGGEEFLIVLYPCRGEDVFTAAERFRNAIGNKPVKKDEQIPEEVNLTVSLGVSLMRESDTCIEDLMKRTDDALYFSKKEGRNRSTLA